MHRPNIRLMGEPYIHLQQARHRYEQEQLAQWELEARREEIASMRMLVYCAGLAVLVVCGVIVFVVK